MWPGYRDRKPRAHVLSTEQDGHLVTLDGEVLPASTYAEFVTSALSVRADVQADSILSWHWFREAVADPRATINAVSEPDKLSARVVGITWRQGNQWCSLFPVDAWPSGDLANVQAACDALGTGTYSSPSALGQASMRLHTKNRYTTGSDAVNEDIRKGMVGGRTEGQVPWQGSIAYEQDRRMAYVAECLQELPVGTARRIFGPGVPSPDGGVSDAEYPAYYVRAVIYVSNTLAVGPFPLRLPSGDLSYPVNVGTYEDVWLTKGELEDCLEAGCRVIVRDGWAWSKAEPVLREWAQMIFRAREQATPAVADCIKKVAVAAIGWHAMRPGRLVTSRDPSGIPILMASGVATVYTASEVDDSYPSQMLVWVLHIWAGARRALYRRQLAEIQSGNEVVMTNFDSILTVRSSTLPMSANVLGEWRESVLTTVKVNALRWIECDQKRITPGQRRIRAP